MLGFWCLGACQGEGTGYHSREHLPPNELVGGLLTSFWKDRPWVLFSGASPPHPTFWAEPRDQSGCCRLSGHQMGNVSGLGVALEVGLPGVTGGCARIRGMPGVLPAPSI